MTANQKLALEMLRQLPHREIYESGDSRGRGTGKFYVTYGKGKKKPELSSEEVRQLVESGHITLSQPDKPEVHLYRLIRY